MKKNKPIPITRPTLEAYTAYAPLFKESIESGRLTLGKHTQAFEKKTAQYTGAKHCVALSSCTSGLMLTLKGLGITGEVIIPSFTFSASGHAVLWNNLTPVFADIDPKTYTLDPRSVEKRITKRTSAILATHPFGVVCDVKKLEALAKKHNLKLIFDAAHAFGSTVGKKHVGAFGDAEVFSCSPIKLLTTAEGGIVATNNDALAEFVRRGRNYGDDGSNSTEFAGLSARMSEFHAAIGLRSFAKLAKNLKDRRSKAAYLIERLKKIEPRLVFQTIPQGSTTTYYILSVLINPKVLGYTRDELHNYLKGENIATRKYFFPPLHTQPPYKKYAPRGYTLPVTEYVANNILALPLYSHITKADMDRVVGAFRKFKDTITTHHGRIQK